MLKEKVGTITEIEKNEILKLHERRMALQELLAALNTNTLDEKARNDLYEKIVNDTGKTKTAFEQWWQDTAAKYSWKADENGQWNIDFKTNEIFLIAN